MAASCHGDDSNETYHVWVQDEEIRSIHWLNPESIDSKETRGVMAAIEHVATEHTLFFGGGLYLQEAFRPELNYVLEERS